MPFINGCAYSHASRGKLHSTVKNGDVVMTERGKKDRVSIHGSVMDLVVVVIISREGSFPSTSKSEGWL